MNQLIIALAKQIFVPMLLAGAKYLQRIWKFKRESKKIEEDHLKKANDYVNGSDKEFERMP